MTTMSAISITADTELEILCSADGELKYTSIESGNTSWKKGSLQVGIKSTGLCICILNFKIGRPRSFKLTNNVKVITRSTTNPGIITFALKDGANISLNKGNGQDVHLLNNYLEEIKSAKPSVNNMKKEIPPFQTQYNHEKSIRKDSQRSGAGAETSKFWAFNQPNRYQAVHVASQQTRASMDLDEDSELEDDDGTKSQDSQYSQESQDESRSTKRKANTAPRLQPNHSKKKQEEKEDDVLMAAAQALQAVVTQTADHAGAPDDYEAHLFSKMVESEFAQIKSPHERFRVKSRIQELLFEARYGTMTQNQVAASPFRAQYASPPPPRSHQHSPSPATSPSFF